MPSNPAAYPGDAGALYQLGVTACLARDLEPTNRNVSIVLGLGESTVSHWKKHPEAGVKFSVLDRIATNHERHYSEFLREGVDLDSTQEAGRAARANLAEV